MVMSVVMSVVTSVVMGMVMTVSGGDHVLLVMAADFTALIV